MHNGSLLESVQQREGSGDVHKLPVFALCTQLLLVFVLRKLVGFAEPTNYLDLFQSQTRDGFSFDLLDKSVLQSVLLIR